MKKKATDKQIKECKAELEALLKKEYPNLEFDITLKDLTQEHKNIKVWSKQHNPRSDKFMQKLS